jgi:[NiFe] hydrogenase diaphorase moiety large subunit
MSDHHIIDQVLARHGHDGTRLMQILRETQEATELAFAGDTDAHRRWRRLAARPGQRHRRLLQLLPHPSKRGKYCVLWSDNITDRMLGNAELMDAMCKKLWLEPGPRLGGRVGQREHHLLHRHVRPGPGHAGELPRHPAHDSGPLGEMVGLIREQKPVSEWPAEWFAVEDNIRSKDILLGHELQPGQALKAALERGRRPCWPRSRPASCAVAAAPAFRHRHQVGSLPQCVRQRPNPAHYVVCNADEGEPGTFKDRVLLTTTPTWCSRA